MGDSSEVTSLETTIGISECQLVVAGQKRSLVGILNLECQARPIV